MTTLDPIETMIAEALVTCERCGSMFEADDGVPICDICWDQLEDAGRLVEIADGWGGRGIFIDGKEVSW